MVSQVPFDHAQSPRLGQRLAPENPGVQLVTVETLPEVAFRGQIVYLLDQNQFRVFDGEGWREPSSIPGGGETVKTFVGPDTPAADRVGDLWISTVDYQLRTWTGADWALTFTPQAQLTPAVSMRLLDTVRKLERGTTQSGETAAPKTHVIVYYMTNPPENPMAEDIWANLVTNLVFRYSEEGWQEITSGDYVRNIRNAGLERSTGTDFKINIYRDAVAPVGGTAADIGDIWVDTSSDDRRPYNWTGAVWAPIQLSSLDLAPDSVNKDALGPGAVTEDSLASIINLATQIRTVPVEGSSQSVTIDSTGVRLIGPTGNEIVTMPTTGETPRYTGTADLLDASLGGATAITGPATINNQGSVEIAESLRPPSQGPNVTLFHDGDSTLYFEQSQLTGNYAYLSGADYNSQHIFMVVLDGAAAQKVAVFPRTGGFPQITMDLPSTGYHFYTNWKSVVLDRSGPAVPSPSNPLTLWVIGENSSAWDLVLRRYTWTGTAFAYQQHIVVPKLTASTYYLGCGTNTLSTQIYIGGQDVNSERGVVYSIRTDTYALSATYRGTNKLPADVAGFIGGLSYDFGSKVRSFFYTYAKAYGYEITTDLPRLSTDDFELGPTPMDNFMLAWSPSDNEFRGIADFAGTTVEIYEGKPSAFVRHKRFSGITWTTETANWWVAQTWRKSNSLAETPEGAKTNFTMKKRYSLMIESPTEIPYSMGADALSFYVARTKSPPNRDAFRRYDNPVLPPMTSGRSFDHTDWSSILPPSPTDTTRWFPALAPGIVRSAARRANGQPKFEVTGQGIGRFDGLIPPGVMLMWSTDGAPEGWLLCHGQAVSRTIYPDLYATLGTTFGAGDGSTTFNLPDMRSRFPLGASTRTTGIFRSVGAVDGLALEERTDRLTHAHSHSISGQPAAQATATGAAAQVGILSRVDSMHNHNHSGSTGSGGAPYHPATAFHFIIKY